MIALILTTNHMHLVDSKEDFIAFFQKFYPNYKPKKFPKFYPCYVKAEEEGGGLVGEYWQFYFFSIAPGNSTVTDVLNGTWKAL